MGKWDLGYLLRVDFPDGGEFSKTLFVAKYRLTEKCLLFTKAREKWTAADGRPDR
jgi:hypothetical protein